MKYGILSDIHGSYTAAKKAISLLKEKGCTHFFILGDALYHGPRNPLPEGHDVAALVAFLNEHSNQITMVQGNCDAEVDQMVLLFPIQKSVDLLLDGYRIHLEHGHHLQTQMEQGTLLTDFVFYGHTHVYEIHQENGITFFNPGSVSLPKMNQEPTCATYEKGKIILYTLEGEQLLEN